MDQMFLDVGNLHLVVKEKVAQSNVGDVIELVYDSDTGLMRFPNPDRPEKTVRIALSPQHIEHANDLVSAG